MKIAVLIPITSNKRKWKDLSQTDFLNYFIKSFFSTYDTEYNYTIYLGIDKDDKLYSKKHILNLIQNTIKIMKNADVQFHFFDKRYKGKPCWIWNKLYDYAYNDNCDYFIQCGSDINFVDKGWVKLCITRLKDKDDIGVCGLVDSGRKKYNPNDTLLTQTMVSRKHKDIFGFYFPESLPNWSSDNWIGDIYDLEGRKIIIGHRLYNLGGEPRYNVQKEHKENYLSAIKKFKNNINLFISKQE